MKHPNDRYNSIQDTSGKLNIPSLEPVFLLRGCDALAVETVKYWCKLAEEQGVNKVTIEPVQAHIKVMERWLHKKLPDLEPIEETAPIGHTVSWTIEKGSYIDPDYYTIDESTLEYGWTKNSTRALQFCRKDDADAVSLTINESVRVGERLWSQN